MKRLLLFLLAVFPIAAFAQRTPLEQGLVDWARERTYVHVDGVGSTTGPSIVWDVTGTEDIRRELFDITGRFYQGVAQRALRKADNFAVSKAQAGDRELALAVGRAFFEERLDWLGFRTDKAGDYLRYFALNDTILELEPYSLPQRLGSAELLLEASLLFKGYTIDMHLAHQRKWLALTPEEREKARRIEKLADQQKFLTELRWLARDNMDKFEREHGQEWRDINAELAQYSEWEQLLVPQTAYGLVPTIPELQSLIDEDTLAIDIVVGRSLEQEPYSLVAEEEMVYLGTAFDKNGVYGPFVLGKAKPIDQFIDALTVAMQNPTQSPPELMNAARMLRQAIFDPFLQHAAGKKRLLMSLDGHLQFAPVPMLPDANDRFLIEDYEVSFFDSFRQLVNTSARRSLHPAQKSLLVGDPEFLSDELEAKLGDNARNRILTPLTGTRKEIETAALVLARQGQPVTKLLGEEATEPAFYQALNQPNEIIHFATHGCFFDPTETTTDPLQRAALTLTDAEDTLRLHGLSAEKQPDDGLVQASEILQLNLRDSRLVILSACDTAMGEVTTGDIVKGFRGAFFIAGVPNVILTLVPVSDAVCPVLMTKFYLELASSRDESQAWTNAVRHLLKDPFMAERATALKYLGPFILVSNRPAVAQDWPVGPVRGFINWRRPLATHNYVQAIKDDPTVGLYLTDDFRSRLEAVDSPRFGLVPASARVLQVDRAGDEAFVKVNALDKSSVFITVKENGRWLVDDIIETTPK